MTAYPHGAQAVACFFDLLMKTSVGQRRAAWGEDRRRVGNTPGLIFQQLRQA
jgi:hypothetical protein